MVRIVVDRTESFGNPYRGSAFWAMLMNPKAVVTPFFLMTPMPLRPQCGRV
jgi:hypothetical protein